MKKTFTASPWGIAVTCLSMVGLLSGCPSAISEKSDDGPATAALPPLPKAGVEAGVYSIDTSGGSGGTDAQGGQAGTIDVVLSNGGNGRLEVLKHGKANAAFNVTTKGGELGPKPVIITTSQEILALDPAGQKPSLNTPYTVFGDFHLYIASSSSKFPDPAEVATGLQIDSGATLKLNANNINNSEVFLIFSNDVVNHGAIITADVGQQPRRARLRLWVNNYIANGTITTKGTAIDARANGQAVQIEADGVLLNSGAIDASGYNASVSDAVDGGRGGSILLGAFASLENTGALSAGGGDTESPDRNGGLAGEINLSSGLGHVYNSGAIDASGGNGTLAGGGGSYTNLYINVAGELRNSGSINSSGGEGKGNVGGDAGQIKVMAMGGSLANSGNLLANGGKAANGFRGGNGGNISVETGWGYFETSPGHILLSGNMSSKGGTSVGTGTGLGGNGGNISVHGNAALEFPNAMSRQLLGLWGYTVLTAAGGTGRTGGAGGAIDISSETGSNTLHPGNWAWVTSGNVVNEADIKTVGGNSSFLGGLGGQISIAVAPFEQGGLADPSTVHNTGTLTTTAGINKAYLDSAQYSGRVNLVAAGGILNSGKIESSGSEDADLTDGRGNRGGEVWLLSGAGPTSNTAAIRTSGGNGQRNGEEGGSLIMGGVTVVNSGDVTTTGGNALSTTLSATEGGRGGRIFFIAKAANGVTNSGIMNYKGGTGKTAGYDGHFMLLSGM